MYSFLEIELIWKNCTTGEEWDCFMNLFTWLLEDPDFIKNLTDEKAIHFQEVGLRQLNTIIENGKD